MLGGTLTLGSAWACPPRATVTTASLQRAAREPMRSGDTPGGVDLSQSSTFVTGGETTDARRTPRQPRS
jgi:hypothetical protein